MGEIRVSVRVLGVRQDGTPLARVPSEAEALVDTGASKTIVSRRVADLAGVYLTPAVGRVQGIGTSGETVDVGLAFVGAQGCRARLLLVGVSDRITMRANAEIVLGHDYMQGVPMTVRPRARTATCPKPRGKRAAARRAAG